ncbi:DUF6457 domain-containing protein [Cryobacterium melibiosiphilum]|uniref:DUF6457 domain-containing protein n=1 Tax=Cryobacterium melibiosiphilum TaxID=995039 RepID=UPI0018F70428|nr:DUF6457 domain-containing protein [Cryobacterium melibiosiphilum]
MTDPSPIRSTPSESDLAHWTRQLTQALQILDLDVDRSLVADLAARSTASGGPASAPLTTFVVGYAAGLAAATGSGPPHQAVSRAADVALQVCAQADANTPRPATAPDAPDAPDAEGWLSTAQ